MSTPIAHERRVLDIPPEEALWINPVKMKSKGRQLLHIEDPQDIEDAIIKECWRRAMDEELRSI